MFFARILKEIKAFHVTLFILAVLLMLAPFVYFAPENGWDLGGIRFNFLTKENLLHPKKQEKKDITTILTTVDTTMVVEDPMIQHNQKSNGDLGAPSGGTLKEEASTELLMNAQGKANLANFFEQLKNAAGERKKVSILHYGDSQIEGDRMTSYIRQKIQDQFGGNGPGLIPATNVYNTFTFKQTYSENFKRYTCFGGEALQSKHYGAMASASRFTPEYSLDSTLSLDTLKTQVGWIEFSPSKAAYSRAKVYNNVRMHYNSCIAPTVLKVYQNNQLIHEENLIEDGAQHTLKLSFPQTPGILRYEFTGKISPNICGFSLEGDYGIQVSNIAMRGSSGTIFGKIKHSGLRTMYEELNARLIILQFGGNSVPSFTDSASVRNYANYFKGQMNTVKRLNPNAMIVVIGPSDMSVLKEGIYETYPFLPYCVEEMKRVTIASGGAFWNLFAAMGGENSMPAWVEKGLAGKDYIHFSNGGAKFASQLFYDAFIAQYAKWEKSAMLK